MQFWKILPQKLWFQSHSSFIFARLHWLSPAQKPANALKLRNAIIISEINMLSNTIPVLVILHQSRMQENIDNWPFNLHSLISTKKHMKGEYQECKLSRHKTNKVISHNISNKYGLSSLYFWPCTFYINVSAAILPIMPTAWMNSSSGNGY